MQTSSKFLSRQSLGTGQYRKKSIVKDTAKFLLSQDMYAEVFNLNVGHGRTSVGSVAGCIFTFLSILIILSYGTRKFYVMNQYADTDIQETVNLNAYPLDISTSD